jgi:arginyl-tRNA synthetase
MTYALDLAQEQIQLLLAKATGSENFEMKTPPPNVDADLAVPLFRLAKEQGENPAALAGKLAAELDLSGTLLASASVTGGFLNFKLDERAFARAVFADFERQGLDYGGSRLGAGKTVVIDFSSPNIAKPFSVGHLRSTVIGDSIGRILRFLGYRVVGDNHIGDWGTQFGKLMVAFATWGDKEKVAAHPIEELLALYVRFHEEAEKDPALEDQARAWFKRLEEGDEEARSLWTWFREVSWLEFSRTYQLLGIEFEEVLGESFYNDRLDDIVRHAFETGLATWGELESRGDGEEGSAAETTGQPERVALIHLEDHGIETPLLIQKSDGTSLYATRDLATIRHRMETWQPAEILYVVGGEQKLYFRQVFLAAELLGYGAHCTHVPFGLIRLPKGRMSTRKGNVIFLDDVLEEAVSRAEAVLEDRDLSPEEKKEIARIVGIGAVKYADLSQTRTKDVLFDWDKMLNMQGDSAPYLQYAYVRTLSIVRRADAELLASSAVDPELLAEPQELALVKTLARFPEAVRSAGAGHFPHLIATYLVELAREFSSFYNQVPVLKAEPRALAVTRLELCQRTAQVLKCGLQLLGIECPERM